MMNPEQQAAWAILQTTFSFVTGEFRQRWQLAREAKKEATAEPPKPEVSTVIQAEAQAKLAQFKNTFELKQMSGNLKSAQKIAENSHRLWNKLREQWTLASPDARARLEIQMEDAIRTRDDATAEIKNAQQTLLETEIIIESPKANSPA